jgi:uncharacterized protein YfaS (alpha-2-macroglobulin family)
MNRRWIVAGGVLLLIVLVGIILSFSIDRVIKSPDHIDDQRTFVVGSSNLVPGSNAALRVVVQHADSNLPIEGADLKVSLQPVNGGPTETLYEGTTNALGTADVQFLVPEDVPASAEIIIETESSIGRDRLAQAVNTERSFKILLTTDKPLYQPGQIIHVRALALSTFDLKPATAQPIEFVITDGKGNRVFRETVTSSEFGVAATDFTLATQVNTGPYKLTAQMGNTTSEKTVTVERYVLPKYEVIVTTDRDFYLPGEHVIGQLQADYFFGKPVTDSQVLIEGFTFDVQRQVVVQIDGQTDANGSFTFEFDLPTYIAGSDLDGGTGRFYMQATVTDQTNHSEESSISLPVAQNAIVIEAVPESGMLRPSVENIVYIITSYPDGSPAPTALTIQVDQGQPTSISTGEYGLAEFRFTPTSPYAEFYINAVDAAGNSGDTYIYTEGEWQEETVLLRPTRATYRVGEMMELDVFTSAQSGSVYLDIIREGQTVSTRALNVENGHAVAAVDLTPDLYGTLELHAYKILSSGSITRDTRLVIVDAPTDLSVTVSPDQQVYLPGETANIGFQVADGSGTGVASVLGLAVVDESVFALAEQDPGFAKLYFMLEQEILQPRYDLHGFSIPEMISQPAEDQTIRSAQDQAAQASLAGSAPATFGLQLDSRSIKQNEAYARRAEFFDGLLKGTLPLLYILPLAAVSASIMQMRRQEKLKYSLKWAGIGFGAAAIVAMALGFLLLTSGFYYSGDAEILLLIIAGVGLLALIATGVIALIRGDWALVISSLAMLLYAAAVVVIGVSSNYAGFSPDEGPILIAPLIFLALPLAFAMRAAAFRQDQQRLALAATALVAAPLLCMGVLLISTLTMSFGGTGALGGIANNNDVMALQDVAVPAMGVDERVEEAEVPVEMAGEALADDADGSTASQGGEPPRLRQYFPETLYWNPSVVTDDQGNVTLDIPMADSITTWRLSALASSQDGRLGASTAEIRVFQDFFIDLDLPLALTQNDEIAVPVGVFNYLPQAQTVRLVLEPGDWFELQGEAEQTIPIEANDIQVVYFRIKAVDFGTHPLTVTAFGETMSDAIQKHVTVYPDGKRIDFSESDRLEETVNYAVDIPQSAVQGTSQVVVKIYPGVVSQVVEGLDSMLRMPYGCFEQTSSTTYPNILVLNYLKTTGQTSPETQFKAEEYINLGYQRLTTFEVAGGGFSLFGDAPADRMLTAYGLQEFSDMSEVHDVDEAIIDRAAQWLMSQQSGDGSWENDQGLVHETTWSSLENDRLPVTAYIVWSLIEAGYGDDGRVQDGLEYIRQHLSEADDPYVVALVANALVADDPSSSAAQQVLDELAGHAQLDGTAAFWSSGVATFMGSEGQTGSIETTALATFVLLRADSHPELANGGLTFLVREKDSFGTWYSTQATVLTLKALLESVKVGGENVNATVNISLNDGQAHTVQITPENFDVVQMVVFDNVSADAGNTIQIQVQGEGDLMYQISGSYYLPWSDVPLIETEEEAVSIDVAYDRTELSVDDTVGVQVEVALNQEGTAEWALIDLGIPPGFDVVVEDLNALLEQYLQDPEGTDQATIKRYELTGSQILIYIGNLKSGQPLRFSYRLRAKFPIIAQTPASSVYDYYNPGVAGVQQPEVIIVND